MCPVIRERWTLPLLPPLLRASLVPHHAIYRSRTEGSVRGQYPFGSFGWLAERRERPARMRRIPENEHPGVIVCGVFISRRKRVRQTVKLMAIWKCRRAHRCESSLRITEHLYSVGGGNRVIREHTPTNEKVSREASLLIVKQVPRTVTAAPAISPG